jgi:hypothetical protein
VQIQQLALLLARPLLVPDGPVQVVVVALTALLAVPVQNLVLLLQQSRNLRPLLHAPPLVQLTEGIVFLSCHTLTLGVQALRSLIIRI